MSSYTKAYGRVLIHYLTSRIHFESSRVNNWLLELIMFAARFDPTKVVREEPKIIPQKRAIPDDVEGSDSDQDIEDGVEVGAVSKEQSGTDVTTTRAVDGKSESDSESESESESDSDDEMNFDMGGSSSSSDDDEVSSKDADVDDDGKHTSVLSRFKKTLSIQDKISALEEANTQDIPEDGEAHDLAQIPQPAVVRDKKLQVKDISEMKNTAFRDTRKVHYDNSMTKSFEEYSDDLTPKLLNNIEKYFSKTTFPIQTAMLDQYLKLINFTLKTSKKNFTRRIGDILVNASTGSGKTLAYSIPIIQTLSSRTVNKLRVLIILPTKLLINQVFQTMSQLAEGTSLVITVSKLENSFNEEHKRLLKTEPDIFITTPGRLVDHLTNSSISLRNLKFLVLDEADRLLNQSFQNWIPEVMSKFKSDKFDQMPGSIIKMVFSATLTTNTEKLNDLQLYNPTLFATDSVKLYNLPPTLQEYQLQIPSAKSVYKPLYLLKLLEQLSGGKTLVFVRSNESSLKLEVLLKSLIKGHMTTLQIVVHSINSNNSKAENRRLVTDFTKESLPNQTNVLITTDLMSRGIDIENIANVINYDVPISSQQYVHRCGRTARANKDGKAYNMLVGKGEAQFWKDSIDEDISRDVSGCKPISYNDSYNKVHGDENARTSEPTRDLFTSIDSETSDKYNEILKNLTQK